MAVSHGDDLCFGCGLANVFGLQIEFERQADGAVTGRFFVKQDHQGSPGHAHGGILAAALNEAASVAASASADNPLPTTRLEVDLLASAPIGTFVHLRARVEEDGEDALSVLATAHGDGPVGPELARARARLARRVG